MIKKYFYTFIILSALSLTAISGSIIIHYGDLVFYSPTILEDVTIKVINGTFISYASISGFNSQIIVEGRAPEQNNISTFTIYLYEGWNLVSVPLF